MEPRQMLDADPVVAGITYLEVDTGQDLEPDYFEVTFMGGSVTTQMTQFVINGDQDLSGTLSDGDVFFDVNTQYPGTGHAHSFQFHAGGSRGVLSDDVLGVTVSDDGAQMVVNIKNFEAGDILAFTVDVDEVERFRFDKIASGVEFEGSFFNATFVDEHYTFSNRDVNINTPLSEGPIQPQFDSVFFDEYDNLLTTGERLGKGQIDLTRDNETGHSDRTAGAIDVYNLKAKPIEISGNVYHDADINCEKGLDETGIANVGITLQRFNSSSNSYETVAMATTDSNGHYIFGKDLGLMPGKFRLIESQPNGYLDVAASVGTVNGVAVGDVVNPNVLSEVNIPLGGNVASNYDFTEVLPTTISGNVYHDRNDNGIRNSGEEGIANVLIRITRISAEETGQNDPFADSTPIFVRTDANGRYEVTGLPPGVYQVTEINNYPPGQNPLASYIDGKDTIGTIRSQTVGTKVNDSFNAITLCSDEDGVEYNFGELRPASIGGYVSITTPEGDCLDPTEPNHRGISGVTIQLYDLTGKLVASTTSNADGHYEFSNLVPGTYSIVEVQPAGYLDGDESIGKVGNTVTGLTPVNDRFVGVKLNSGDAGTNYNFCEHLPAQLQGTVWYDVNNDGIMNNSEKGIAGVTIRLFDNVDNVVAELVTDSNGRYSFENLIAGEYKVQEIQPGDYVDGKESIGRVANLVNGEVQNDAFVKIVLKGGQTGDHYDFGEIRMASITGFVHLDPNGDCIFDTSQGDRPLAGVTMQLLGRNGEILGSTLTDSSGHYAFNNLVPGTYSIRQVQPAGLFTSGETVGSGTGVADTNIISEITLVSAQHVTRYNFCEQAAAEIHGRVWEDGPAFESESGLVPDGYRNQRDSIYQTGVDTPIAGVRMELWYYVDPTNLSIAPRRVTLGEVLNSNGEYDHLGSDPNAAIWIDTMADGQYSFTGLNAGNYIVLESQPTGYIDANDTPGSTSGFSYNSAVDAALAPNILVSTFSGTQLMDSIINIRVNSGDVSVLNNFSEVRAVSTQDPPFLPPLNSPQTPANPITPLPPPGPGFGLAGQQAMTFTAYIGGGRGIVVDAVAAQYTWHLSVVNAGQPRGGESDSNSTTWLQASYLSENDWNRFDMQAGEWAFATTNKDGVISIRDDEAWFGMIDGIPLSGDFDGDGDDEVVVYKDGYWMIDLNGNGRWDIDDMMARLGNQTDRPVIGDWDGDGKDDIGIFGPIWEGDHEAIAAEPGIPDPANINATPPKNLPPEIVQAAEGSRAVRLSGFGSSRIDVIDHVFGYGEKDDVPVTGDWNGDSIRTIGIFRDGIWQVDSNGDGQFDFNDDQFSFGRAGDIPLVGDFDGDGIEEIAVFRNGTWIIDTNGNRELEATDKVFEMGGRGDLPVVGDWDGDGIDEPATYHAKGSQANNL